MESVAQTKIKAPAALGPLPAALRWWLVLLTPALMVLSFPDFDYSFLAWMALTPLLYVIGTQPLSLKTSFGYGALAGALFFYGSCYWITYPMIQYGGIPPWLAYALTAIPAVISGAFWGPVALGARWSVVRFGVIGLFLTPMLWVVAEWARYQCTGMGWNSLGYSQAFHPWVIQMASQTGVYGISFLLAATATGLAGGVAVLLNHDRRPRVSVKRRTMLVSGGMILGAYVMWLGLVQSTKGSDSAADRHRPNHPLQIIAIQPNVPVEALFDPAVHDQSFAQLLSLTEKETVTAADLIVWPESPLNLSPTQRPDAWQQIMTLVGRHNAHLVLNMIGESPPQQFHNSVAMIAPDGRILSRYDKVRLLPFGEYVPLRGVLPFLDQIPALAGDFMPGQRYPVAAIGDYRMGSFICSESAMPEIARRLAKQQATLFIEVTNDAWFGPTPAAKQHLAHSIFRAVENDCHLVRVTNSGITAYITPAGQVQAPTGLFQADTRRWAIDDSSYKSEQTVYTRQGDVFVLFCAGWSVIGLCLASRRWSPLRTRATY